MSSFLGFFDANFWHTFLTSAGFGGLMALAAAVIATRTALGTLRHTRELNARDRWWDTLKWTYEKTAVGEGASAMPRETAYAILRSLVADLPDTEQTPDNDIRREAVQSIMDMLLPAQSETVKSGESEPASGMSDSGLLVADEELSGTQINSPAGLIASFPTASTSDATNEQLGKLESQLYAGPAGFEQKVLRALRRYFDNTNRIIASSAMLNGVEMDALVTGRQGLLAVEVKYSERGVFTMGRLLDIASRTAARTRATGAKIDRVLLIVNGELDPRASEEILQRTDGFVIPIGWPERMSSTSFLMRLERFGISSQDD